MLLCQFQINWAGIIATFSWTLLCIFYNISHHPHFNVTRLMVYHNITWFLWVISPLGIFAEQSKTKDEFKAKLCIHEKLEFSPKIFPRAPWSHNNVLFGPHGEEHSLFPLYQKNSGVASSRAQMFLKGSDKLLIVRSCKIKSCSLSSEYNDSNETRRPNYGIMWSVLTLCDSVKIFHLSLVCTGGKLGPCICVTETVVTQFTYGTSIGSSYSCHSLI